MLIGPVENMNRRRKTDDETVDADAPVFRCAVLTLPYLHPRELAAASSTCKTLNRVCRTITSVRCSDASRNFENFRIPFVNASVDHRSPPYSYFIYTPRLTLYPPRFQPWGSPITAPGASRLSDGSDANSDSVGFRDGCDSDLRLGSSRVGLTRLSSDDSDSLRRELSDSRPDTFGVGPYSLGLDSGGDCGCGCLKCGDECACLVFGSGLDSVGGVMGECASSCGCGVDCLNRIGQQGIAVDLKIVRDERKGWGLYAAKPIQSGQFVCEYAGELLTTEEARRRQQIYDELSLSGQFSSALLVVREHLPSGKACLRINIDATRVGNVARFINHSCDGGNLSTVLVRSSGSLIPRLGFFASKDIKKDEELSFSYGTIRLKKKGLKCFCGSSCCSGVLPSELT